MYVDLSLTYVIITKNITTKWIYLLYTCISIYKIIIFFWGSGPSTSRHGVCCSGSGLENMRIRGFSGTCSSNSLGFFSVGHV